MLKTRTVRVAVAALIVVLVVSVVYLVWSHYFSLEVGDSWTLALTSNEANCNLTMTVIGKETVNNVGCYVMKLVFDPEGPLVKGERVSNEMMWWLADSTLHLMKMEGKVHVRAYGWDLTFIEEHFYTFQGKPSLTVGNEHRETDNRELNIYCPPPTNILFLQDKTTTITRIKVEAVESITVPAGTFRCYKIVTYDETGQNILSIRWFSIKAKTAVRIENYEAEEFEIFETAELLSYSVQ